MAASPSHFAVATTLHSWAPCDGPANPAMSSLAPVAVELSKFSLAALSVTGVALAAFPARSLALEEGVQTHVVFVVTWLELLPVSVTVTTD